jgi:cation diffusion facilitator CzcD-associated flavoprotein CzcO
LNTDVSICKWLKEEEVWEITLHHMVPGVGDLSSKDRARKEKAQGERSVWAATETIRAKVLISAVGGIVEPRDAPSDVPGWDNFKGDVFHSARWNYNVDFNNKDVVVVGTGCSAAQFVPRLTKAPFNAKSVTQIMRSPPWVVNRQTPPGGDEAWKKWSPTVFKYVPGLLKLIRFNVAATAEWDWRLFGGGEFNDRERKKLEVKLLEHMKKSVPEKYHEILTPDYSVGCKRRIFDHTWFPMLNDENVELTTLPLTEVLEKSVKLGPGRMYPDPAITTSKVSNEEKEIPADVIVLANGFDVTRWLHPMTVIGTEGQDLVDTMQERGGPQAYQGTALDGVRTPSLSPPFTSKPPSLLLLTHSFIVSKFLHHLRPKHHNRPFQRRPSNRKHGKLRLQIHFSHPLRLRPHRRNQERSRNSVYTGYSEAIEEDSVDEWGV